jgi:hypothetical protein
MRSAGSEQRRGGRKKWRRESKWRRKALKAKSPGAAAAQLCAPACTAAAGAGGARSVVRQWRSRAGGARKGKWPRQCSEGARGSWPFIGEIKMGLTVGAGASCGDSGRQRRLACADPLHRSILPSFLILWLRWTKIYSIVVMVHSIVALVSSESLDLDRGWDVPKFTTLWL